MACYHPLRAYRSRSGAVSLGREVPDSSPLALPCGGCLGCRTDRARGWALRCYLELQSHDAAVFTTLTYAPDQVPPSLQKDHLSAFLKRLRARKRGGLRFFASGEYGEQTSRPHYHAILYGCSERDAGTIEEAWGKGFTRTESVTPARIAYVAGYCQKKIGWRMDARAEIVDPETGEVLQEAWTPPFIQMSRRPGIGANARQFADSWRLFAVHNGRLQGVPRFLHQAWANNATDEQLEDLQYQKSQLQLAAQRNLSANALHAKEKAAEAKHSLRAARRRF